MEEGAKRPLRQEPRSNRSKIGSTITTDSSTETPKTASEVDIRRMEYLNSRLAQLFQAGASSSELGAIALELLAFRNDLETSRSETADDALKQVRELEKMVISLYMLNILGEQKTKVTDYLYRQYSFFER